jgi:peptidoglycan L-alanyl-D-glutamate endopeptidase CwlK
MLNSRNPNDLVLIVKRKFDSMMEAIRLDPWFPTNGIDLIVTSTRRDNESQDALYAQGRTKPGKVVTNAKGGTSAHNFGVAFDIVPTRHGVPIWGTKGNGLDQDPTDDNTDDLEAWERIAAHGRSVGLEWGGDWSSFKDMPHFQYMGGLSMADLRAGKVPA